jgi:hypothetical protein
MALTASSVTELTNTEYIFVDIYTEFYPNWTKSVAESKIFIYNLKRSMALRSPSFTNPRVLIVKNIYTEFHKI